MVTKPIKIVLIEVTEPNKYCINRGYEAWQNRINKGAGSSSFIIWGRKMKWINVDEKYLDYLRAAERRIPRTDYGTDRYKPFFGVLFEVDDLYYVTQVSHAQPRHQSLKQQKDFYKIFDPKNPKRLIAVVNLNYMFPIPKEQTTPFEKKSIHTYRTFKSESEKSKYIDLLDSELLVINTMDIGTKAEELYKLKYDKPEHAVAKRCIDFKSMEQLALQYKNNQDAAK